MLRIHAQVAAAQADGVADPDAEPVLTTATQSTIRHLLMVLECLLCGGESRQDDYKVVVERKSVLVDGEGGGPTRELKVTLGFWCLNPAVAYASMASGARSVILTSGKF